MSGKVDSINSNLSYNTYLTALKQKNVNAVAASNPVSMTSSTDAKVDTCQFSNSTSNAQLKAVLSSRVNAVTADLKEAEDNNGFIGKAWSWTKNTFGFGDSSNKVKKSQSKEKELLANFDKDPKGTFEQLTGVPYSNENVEKFINGEIKLKSEQNLDGYKEGQDMCVDIAGDIVSGVVALGAVAAAPFTGGASLLLAAGAGAVVKTGLKYADAKSAGREYDSFGRDMATGAFSGFLAPLTGGAGGAVGKAVATRMGLEAVQVGAKSVAVNAASQTAKQGLKQGLKTMIANPTGYTYAGGNILKRGVAYGAEMVTDGALGGAVDNAFRTAYDGGSLEDVLNSAKEGFVGGAILSPVIGGGFKVVGHAGHYINNKMTTKNVLPDGVNTKFAQGQAPDCAVLSVIDGMLDNPATVNKIKRAISRDFDGNYMVNIGDKTVIVPKSAITDEMLADKSGIKIFETAYRTLTGELDGGFADVAAKHFGLNPVHIDSSMITDEMLSRLAREKGNGVFSFGAKIDADGNLAKEGTPHYFSIKEIDPASKKVKVVDTYDTSKVIELSFEDVKAYGISIDGGTVKPSTLPNSARNLDDVRFRGVEESLSEKLGISTSELKAMMPEDMPFEDFVRLCDYNGFKEKDLVRYLKSQADDLGCSVPEYLNEFGLQEISKHLHIHKQIQSSPVFSPFNLSLEESISVADALKHNNYDKISEILEKNNSELFNKLNNAADGNYIGKTLNEYPDNITSVSQRLNTESYIDSKYITTLDVDINGSPKKVVMQDGSLPYSKGRMDLSVDKNLEDLIKSNMITTDVLEEILSNPKTRDLFLNMEKSGQPLVTGSVKTSRNVKMRELVDKILSTDGTIDVTKFNQLSPYDIHALTDILKDNYNILIPNRKTFAKKIQNKANTIQGYVNSLKTKAENALGKNSGVEFEDHFFMRMIDRDMLNVIDYNSVPPRYLDYDEFIKRIVAKTKECIKPNQKTGSIADITLPDLGCSHGVSVIARMENGKIIIDSIMM